MRKVSGHAPEDIQKDIELREMRDFGSNVIQQLGTLGSKNPQMVSAMQLMFSQAGLPPAPSPVGSRTSSRTSSARSSVVSSRAGSQPPSARSSASGGRGAGSQQTAGSARSSASAGSRASVRSTSSTQMGGAQTHARSTGSGRQVWYSRGHMGTSHFAVSKVKSIGNCLGPLYNREVISIVSSYQGEVPL